MARFEQVNYSGPLPNKYCEDDLNYIKEQLKRLPTNLLRAKCAHLYSKLFVDTYESEPISYKKENRARHEANIRLRNFIDKQIPYLMGKIDEDEEYKP